MPIERLNEHIHVYQERIHGWVSLYATSGALGPDHPNIILGWGSRIDSHWNNYLSFKKATYSDDKTNRNVTTKI